MTVKSMLPMRKCLYAAKVILIISLIVSLLTLFEYWRAGRRPMFPSQENEYEMELERQVRQDEARIVPGLGAGGAAVHLSGEENRLGDESVKKLAMNVYLSDKISYNRTLKDYRNPACKRVVYDAELPSASVVIIFHNEPYSVLLRTVWSVLNTMRRDQPWYRRANYVDQKTGEKMTLGYPGQAPDAPYVYLKEIILVDDNSTLPELRDKLSHYIKTRMPPIVRVLRLPERVGLTRARLAGARDALGAVLVFLDAQCETTADWLRPLLHRIKHSPHSALVPIIDSIDAATFFYSTQEYTFQVGGFTFVGHFTWVDVPEREKKRRGSDISPTWSPTMAGGLFAMSRSYFWQLGAYDEQMAGWGGENLEMSFRIWQCGGTLETIPCSRVGHVFRSFHPYGLPGSSDTHGINTARMAEVWMDDYAELFYLYRPDLRKSPKIGDVTHRRVLREKLQCKSFAWYLRTVYPEKFVPVRDVRAYGRFRNPASALCLDTMQREGEAVPLGVYPCHSSLQVTQFLSLSRRGELRDEDKCAQIHYARTEDNTRERPVIMSGCQESERAQKWRLLGDGRIQHSLTRLCLAAGAGPGAGAGSQGAGPEAEAAVGARCDADDPRQRWRVDYTEENDFLLDGTREPTEQEIKLQALRGRNRMSRSVLSNAIENIVEGAEPRAGGGAGGVAPGVLHLLRRMMNRTAGHLQAELYYKNRKLPTNSSLVRALVSMLNNSDIKLMDDASHRSGGVLLLPGSTEARRHGSRHRTAARVRAHAGEAAATSEGTAANEGAKREGAGAGERRDEAGAVERAEGAGAGERKEGAGADEKREGPGAGGKRERVEAGEKRVGPGAGGKRERAGVGEKREGPRAGGKRERVEAGEKREGPGAGGKRERVEAGEKREGPGAGGKRERVEAGEKREGPGAGAKRERAEVGEKRERPGAGGKRERVEVGEKREGEGGDGAGDKRQDAEAARAARRKARRRLRKKKMYREMAMRRAEMVKSTTNQAVNQTMKPVLNQTVNQTRINKIMIVEEVTAQPDTTEVHQKKHHHRRHKKRTTRRHKKTTTPWTTTTADTTPWTTTIADTTTRTTTTADTTTRTTTTADTTTRTTTTMEITTPTTTTTTPTTTTTRTTTTRTTTPTTTTTRTTTPTTTTTRTTTPTTTTIRTTTSTTTTTKTTTPATTTTTKKKTTPTTTVKKTTTPTTKKITTPTTTTTETTTAATTTARSPATATRQPSAAPRRALVAATTTRDESDLEEDYGSARGNSSSSSSSEAESEAEDSAESAETLEADRVLDWKHGDPLASGDVEEILADGLQMQPPPPRTTTRRPSGSPGAP